MSELALTLADRQPGSVLNARQQERLPPAQLPLPGAQRKVSAAQLLRYSRRGHTQPPAENTGGYCPAEEEGAPDSVGKPSVFNLLAV